MDKQHLSLDENARDDYQLDKISFSSSDTIPGSPSNRRPHLSLYADQYFFNQNFTPN